MDRLIRNVMLGLLLAVPPAAADRDVLREQSEKTVEVRGFTTLEVVNPRGRVDLLPSPDGKLHVTALKIVRYGSRERAEEIARDIVVETGIRDDRYAIEVRYHKRTSVRISFWDLFRVDGVTLPAYEVRIACQVPPGLPVSVRESSGDIRSEGLAGPQTLRTVSGDIDVQSAGGPIEMTSSSGDLTAIAVRRARVKSVSGDITVRQASAPVHATSSSGRITVTEAADSLTLSSVSGDIRTDRAPKGLDARTSSGDVVAREVAGGVAIHTSSGDVRLALRAPLRGVEAETSSGNIKLELDPGVACALDMRTSSGTIEVEQPMEMRTVTRRNVSGTIRGGRMPVVLHTSSGDITVVGGGE